MTENTQYITLTAKTFETDVLKSPEPVMVDFWADWCGPCHTIAPLIDELAAEFKDRVKVGKVDVDQNPEISRRFGIRSIPSHICHRRTSYHQSSLRGTSLQTLFCP